MGENHSLARPSEIGTPIAATPISRGLIVSFSLTCRTSLSYLAGDIKFHFLAKKGDRLYGD